MEPSCNGQAARWRSASRYLAFSNVGQEGPLPNPTGHIFPILTHDDSEQWELVGTGFYVSSNGLFVTARHVIDYVFKGPRQTQPLVILHMYSESGLFGPQHSLLRPISQCWLGERNDPDPIYDPPDFLPRPECVDLAFGVAGNMIHKPSGCPLANIAIALSWNEPAVGSTAATYAFPNREVSRTDSEQIFSFRPDAYSGQIDEISDRRGRSIPHPHYVVDFRIHGGASGGPVFCSSGQVVGVNSREMAGTGPGYVTPVRLLEGAFIENASLSAEGAPGLVTFAEVVNAGAIRIDGYIASDPPTAKWGRVVHLTRIPTAKPPNVTVTIYY